MSFVAFPVDDLWFGVASALFWQWLIWCTVAGWWLCFVCFVGFVCCFSLITLLVVDCCFLWVVSVACLVC